MSPKDSACPAISRDLRTVPAVIDKALSARRLQGESVLGNEHVVQLVELAAAHAFGRGFRQLASILLQRIESLGLLRFRQ